MHTLILLEISRLADGSTPTELIRLAYLASRRGRIVLLLNGVTSEEVDAVLDPLVWTLPLDMPGLRYLDCRDQAVSELIEQASMLFLSTELLAWHADTARRAGRGNLSPDQATQVLARLSQPTCLKELQHRSIPVGRQYLFSGRL